jgi:hypothetical protein
MKLRVFNYQFKKDCFIALLLTMTMASQFLFFLPKAEAQFIPGVPVIETNATVYLPILAGRATQEIHQSFVEIAFQALKKRLLDMVTDQIIDYINGNGTPKFITDWRGFFETIAQVAVGDIVQQMGLGFLCSPFKLQVRLAMIAPPRFTEQITCTLGQIVRNIDNFYSDFRNGGWLVYQELWAPNNNFYGSLLLAWNAKENEIAARVAAAGNEALASQGFLSVKKCQKDAFGRDIPRTCVITTPGVAIGSLAQKAIGADVDYIVNSTDLAVYVSAIADALINRIVRSGVEGLGGTVLASRPPRNISNLVGCDNLIGRARTDCLTYTQSYGGSYTRASKVTLAKIDAALQPRLQAQQILDNLISLEEQVMSKLIPLDQCQLGRHLDLTQTEALIRAHQANLDRYYRMSYDNDYYVSQLTTAAQVVGQSSSFATLALTDQILNAPAAQQFLVSAQTEQAINQAALTSLINNLQNQLTQCQSGL